MENHSRRQFLTKSGSAALAGCLGTLAANGNEMQTKTLKVGIVGLGGRGSGAVMDILESDPNVVLWAMGDVNEGMAKKRLAGIQAKYGDRIQCQNREFYGYDSFEKVKDSGIDIILLTTPPAFRPAQVKKSFEKGLHVFAEKPWCVDTKGMLLVKDAVEAANKKGLSFLTGLVWRHTPVAQKLYETALSGELGDVINSQGYYCLWRDMKHSPLDPAKHKTLHDHNQSRKWFLFSDLGGDWIMEQFIHSVDKLGWSMGDQAPKRCYGVGGRPYDYAIQNTTRHINITYEYDDGRRSYLNGSHQSRFGTIHDEIFCSKGSTHLSHGKASMKKNRKQVYQANSVPLGYQREHVTFVEHIRSGKVYTDIESSLNTHLLAIMGRMAAYSGQEIYPEDVMESEEVFFDSEKQWTGESLFKPRAFASPATYKL